ncbi:MAG: hypothetical protein AB1420_07530 [Bacillota bacterium]
MIGKWKMFVAGFLTCILLTASITGALVAANDISIQAVLSNTIKLKLNGQDWAPKDPVTGDYFKPIVYNGRTYLPVRAIVEEAAKMPLEYDAATNTIWIGGKKEILEVKELKYYENYYGTILTTDNAKLATPHAAYKWGITNDKPMNMQYFTFYLKPDGKYSKFRASFYLDDSAPYSLTMNIRKDSYNGEVIKAITLEPGETLENVDININGIKKFCIESNITPGYGTIYKLVVGEPVFFN